MTETAKERMYREHRETRTILVMVMVMVFVGLMAFIVGINIGDKITKDEHTKRDILKGHAEWRVDKIKGNKYIYYFNMVKFSDACTECRKISHSYSYDATGGN